MNQRVLVTAGASGIGREITSAFVANGAKVFLSDINAEGLDALSKEIKGVMTKVCDNSKRSDVEALIHAAVHALGGLDVLVNNAGISGPTAPVEQVEPLEAESSVTTIKVYTRHNRGCSKREQSDWARCNCMKWLYIYRGGKYNRSAPKLVDGKERSKKRARSAILSIRSGNCSADSKRNRRWTSRKSTLQLRLTNSSKK